VLNLITCLKPIQLWHRNIEDHYIRLQFASQCEQRSSVVCNANNFELRLEKALASFRQQRVVVCNEQPGSVTMFHCVFRLQSNSFSSYHGNPGSNRALLPLMLKGSRPRYNCHFSQCGYEKVGIEYG
jgi:hypothetical protein